MDIFRFYLAEKLGKTLTELDDVPAAEYTAWRSYFRIKHQQDELAAKRMARAHG